MATKIGRHGELVPGRGFSRRRLLDDDALRGTVWVSHDGLWVISSSVDAFMPGSNDTVVGPSWHISVSLNSDERPSDEHVRRVVEAFALPAFDEDNHHPGQARHLWCPLDPVWRNQCECKLTETTIVEPDGYRWTNPTDGPCRGCLFGSLTGAACTIHGAPRATAPTSDVGA